MVIKGTHSSPITPALACMASKFELVLQVKAAVHLMCHTKAAVTDLQDSTTFHAGRVHGKPRVHACGMTPHSTKLAEHLNRDCRPNRRVFVVVVSIRHSPLRGARGLEGTPNRRFVSWGRHHLRD
jgi:hypothetical protein